jgi:DNA-binding transcriptional MerR regulator/methylmalonyl-CoA mutase cobalamin-binding subunit
MKPVRTINFVARQTGLSVQVIRVWEKRYGAVQPVRADNNRRLYTEEDVERLRLLRDATQAGHAIGQIATASLDELQRLVRETPPLPRPGGKTRGEESEEVAGDLIEHAIVSVADLDARSFRKLLDRAAVELGSPAVLQRFIAPLAERVGDLWRAGDFTIAQEHFASTHITDFLATFARPYSENVTSSHLVLATPPGQLHELGAIIVAAAARSHGWRTTYLGAALPVEEMVGALRNLQPRALGLSIVYPPDDDALRRDLRKLRDLLPKECALLIGGRSSSGYTDLLRKIKAIEVRQLEDLYPVLDKLQRPQSTSAKPKRK